MEPGPALSPGKFSVPGSGACCSQRVGISGIVGPRHCEPTTAVFVLVLLFLCTRARPNSHSPSPRYSSDSKWMPIVLSSDTRICSKQNVSRGVFATRHAKCFVRLQRNWESSSKRTRRSALHASESPLFPPPSYALRVRAAILRARPGNRAQGSTIVTPRMAK